MVFSIFKSFLPRGLYGRAALILFLPIVALQLVVVIGFSQRYFSDVTRQLMAGVQAELNLYVLGANELEEGVVKPALADLDKRLGFASTLDQATGPTQTQKHWYDFSGRIIIEIFEREIIGLEGVDLASNKRMILLSVQTDAGRLYAEIPRKRASASNPHQVILITLFTGGIMAYIAANFLRNQLRPIRRLARAAEEFGRGNNVAYRVAGASEVRAAGMAFLSMRTRIERHIDQRTLILSGVSHDLRTPLTRMKLGLSLLESEDVFAADIKDMQSDVGEMERLLDDFLAFTRSDALEEPEQVNPLELMQGAQERAVRGGGDVIFEDATCGDIMITARPESLARALDNLISNALRYGDRVALFVVAHERSVVLSVEDNGPGIAAEDREKALQPFVRLDTARNQNQGKGTGSGVGLGLAIATDIARKHGGSLRLGQSDALGGLKVDIVISR